MIFALQPTGDPDADTRLLQECLDAAAWDPDHTATLPPGTYLIDGVNESQRNYNQYIGGGLRPPAGVTLLLHPWTVLQVAPSGSPGSSCIYLGPGQDHVTIRGGTIRGDRAEHDYTAGRYPSHEWGYGITVQGAEDVTIDRVTVTGCTGDGIMVRPWGMMNVSYPPPYQPSRRVRITGCTLDGARRNNISVTGCEQVLIEGCRITRAGYHDGIHDGTLPKAGIDIEGYGEGAVDHEVPRDVTVRGNVLEGNIGTAVMNYTGERVVIDGNFSDGTISNGYATQSIIRGNILTDPTGTKTGLHVIAAPQSADAGSIIVDNVVTGFKVGISARGAWTLFAGNLLRSCTHNGIEGWTLTDSVIRGNVVAGAATRGIDIRFNCARVTVAGNTVMGTPTPIRVESGAVDISVSEE